jgi:uncharacterized membrane protein HdeD (DUF308 family)
MEEAMIYLLCDLVGMLLIVAGVLGFANPHVLGMHLTPIHNAILLSTGVVSSLLGFFARPGPARAFSKLFGVAYLSLGVLGFFAPDAVARLLGYAEGVGVGTPMPDNIVHLFLGTLFLAASLPERLGAGGGLTRLDLAPQRFEPRGRPLR